MNIKEALIYAQNELNDYSDSARTDAESLIMHLLKCKKAKLYSHGDEKLNETQKNCLQHFIAHRKQHIPIAYIIGYKEFWSLNFKVSPATLIPRPATECLVAYVLEHQSQRALKILDLGTGTGAIAISLAKERPTWTVTAVDLNPAALAVAIDNAKQNQCSNIVFLQSNWFSRLAGMRYDIIISNPPYIAKNDIHLSQGDVQHEPQLALVSEDEGYYDLAHLITQSKNHLTPQGCLVLEHGYQQQDKILNLMTEAGFTHIEGHVDLENQPRFCVAY